MTTIQNVARCLVRAAKLDGSQDELFAMIEDLGANLEDEASHAEAKKQRGLKQLHKDVDTLMELCQEIDDRIN